MSHIKEEVAKFKETNGNQSFSPKDMMMYLVSRIDKIDEKFNRFDDKITSVHATLNKGSGKIASNKTAIYYLKWAVGIIIGLMAATLGVVAKIM